MSSAPPPSGPPSAEAIRTNPPRMLPPDHDARRRAIEERSRSQIVQAGAGSGKTTTLVRRVLGLLADGEVSPSQIAVITFTERAAAEVTARLVAEGADVTPGGDQDDGVTVTTLHGFAAGLVGTFPIESGAPLRLEVLDEAAAETERVQQLARRLSDPGALDRLGVIFEAADALGTGARQLLSDPRARSPKQLEATWRWATEHLDRIEDGELEPIERPDALSGAKAVLAALPPEEVADWAAMVGSPDSLVEWLLGLLPYLRRLAEDLASSQVIDTAPHGSPDEAERAAIAALAGLPSLAKGTRLGRVSTWPSRELLDHVRAQVRAAEQLRRSTLSAYAQALGQELASLVAAWAAEEETLRWRSGRLMFADLLVGARRLLRSCPSARAELRRRWQRILIDEFQDTDPIQLELACLLASSLEPAELARRLDPRSGSIPESLPVDRGRLFLVGDPLQSIYRFRRADPELFARATSQLSEDDGPLAELRLQASFRTVPEVLSWIDDLVEHLGKTIPGLAPSAVLGDDGAPANARSVTAPLLPTRRGPRADLDGPGRSRLVGVIAQGVQETRASVAEAAAAQAEALGRIVSSIRNEPGRWLVEEKGPDGGARWRPARLGDVALLIPSRTHLARFLDALDALEIPYRTGGGIPLGSLAAFRALSAVVHALVDPSDRLSTAEALRLGPWKLPTAELGACLEVLREMSQQPTPAGDGEEVPGGTSDALSAAARGLSRLRAEVATLDARRALDIAGASFGFPALEEAPLELRLVWTWAERLAAQGRGLRALSELLRETTAQAVRSPEDPFAEAPDALSVLTVHAAKGLEFPIVVVAGFDGPDHHSGEAVLIDPEQRRLVARPVPGPIATKDHVGPWSAARAAEQAQERAERARLAYVACTRARDHLVLLLHRKQASPNASSRSVAELMAEVCLAHPEHMRSLDEPVEPPTEDPLATDDPLATEDPLAKASRIVVGGVGDDDQSERSAGPGQDWPWGWVRYRGRATRDQTRPVERRGPLPVAAASHLDSGPEPAASTGQGHPPDRAHARRLGTAVHWVLEHGLGMPSPPWPALVSNAAARSGVDPHLIERLIEAALASEPVRLACQAERMWRELTLGAVVHDRRLEARVDLVWETAPARRDDLLGEEPSVGALELADYKTSQSPLGPLATVAPSERTQALIDPYRLQLGAYAEALALVTGRAVLRAWIVRCHPDGVAQAALEGDELLQARRDALGAVAALTTQIASAEELGPPE